MKHLQAQLNDSLKELHQKELRIQQLNSKVLIHALYLLAVRDEEFGEGQAEIGLRKQELICPCRHSMK